MRYLILFLGLASCTTSIPKTGVVQRQDSLVSSEHKNVNIKFEYQVGGNSCWAAALNMAYLKPGFPNNANTTSQPFESIWSIKNRVDPKFLKEKSSIEKYGQLSWELMKSTLKNNKPIVFYRYFNPEAKFAHVALLSGYYEANFENQKSERWLLYKDPWPKGQGLRAVLSFDFLRKPIFADLPLDFPKIAIGASDIEGSFNFLSHEKIIDPSLNDTSAIKGEKFTLKKKTMAQLNTSGPPVKMDSSWLKSAIFNATLKWEKKLKFYPKDFMFSMGFDTLSFKEDSISMDKESFMAVHASKFNYLYSPMDSIKFLRPVKDTKIINKEDFYLFDGSMVYYVVIMQNGEKKVMLSYETDTRGFALKELKQVYLTRIEPYLGSRMEILDIAKTQISKDLTKNLKSSKKAMVKLIDFELKYDSIDWIENKTGYYAMVTLSFNSQQHKYLIDPFNAYEGSKADISFRNIRIFKLKN